MQPPRDDVRAREIEELTYWRDYVLLPLLGFFLTVFVIAASGSIIYPLIGYVIAMVAVGAALARQKRKYKECF